MAGAAATAIRSTMNATSATVAQANTRHVRRNSAIDDICRRLGACAMSLGRDFEDGAAGDGGAVSA